MAGVPAPGAAGLPGTCGVPCGFGAGVPPAGVGLDPCGGVGVPPAGFAPCCGAGVPGGFAAPCGGVPAGFFGSFGLAGGFVDIGCDLVLGG